MMVHVIGFPVSLIIILCHSGIHQDLEQESQRRAREVETLEQQLSKVAADTWPDETNNF
jgi:choline-glycine betaine transporter